MKFTILGKIPAKSSGRQLIYAHGRPFFISSKKTRDFERDFESQIGKVKRHSFPDEARFSVTIEWHTDSYRQDVDSPSKVLFDCLQKYGIIKNDNKIDRLHIYRFIDKKNPRAEIEILELP